MTLNTEQIRTLIERWKMKVEVVDGEEKLQVTPPSQQELNKWINHIKNNKTLIINEIKNQSRRGTAQGEHRGYRGTSGATASYKRRA